MECGFEFCMLQLDRGIVILKNIAPLENVGQQRAIKNLQKYPDI
jgi:hypothetical protein